jgi:hypothetical protein
MEQDRAAKEQSLRLAEHQGQRQEIRNENDVLLILNSRMLNISI